MVLVVGTVALCALVIVVALGKHRIRDFPLFFSYLGFCVVNVGVIIAVGLWISDSQALYERLVVLSGTLESVLELAAIYELSSRVLPHFLRGHRLKSMASRTLAGVLLLATVGSALLPQKMPWMRLGTNVSFFNNLIDLGLLLILALIAIVLGIAWPKMASGVGLGLGVSAVGQIVGNFLFGHFGRIAQLPADLVRLGSFHIAAVVWLVSVFLREKPQDLAPRDISVAWFELRAAELGQAFGSRFLAAFRSAICRISVLRVRRPAAGHDSMRQN